MYPVIYNLKNKLTWMSTRLRWINEEYEILKWIEAMQAIHTLLEKTSRNPTLLKLNLGREDVAKTCWSENNRYQNLTSSARWLQGRKKHRPIVHPLVEEYNLKPLSVPGVKLMKSPKTSENKMEETSETQTVASITTQAMPPMVDNEPELVNVNKPEANQSKNRRIVVRGRRSTNTMSTPDVDMEASQIVTTNNGTEHNSMPHTIDSEEPRRDHLEFNDELMCNEPTDAPKHHCEACEPCKRCGRCLHCRLYCAGGTVDKDLDPGDEKEYCSLACYKEDKEYFVFMGIRKEKEI